MKVILLNSSDINGGAARSVYRLYKGLQSINIDVQMFVQSKMSDSYGIIAQNTMLEKGFAKLRPTIDNLPLYFYPERDRTKFSIQLLPSFPVPKIAESCPDIINLHWICDGFLPIDFIRKLRQPLVWTLHDMWAFTGGCHYSYGCDRYLNSCGACPQIHSKNKWDLSHWIWQCKKKNWQGLNVHIVSPSNWLARCAKSSSLFTDLPITVIPNGLDLKVYKPIDKKFARKLLNLPENIKLVLFGAISAVSDLRKGFHLLQSALQKLRQTYDQDQLEVVIMGSSQPKLSLDLGFNSHYLGYLHDDISLALAYSAADVFVAPSTQDNLPNTAIEAISCGVPVVAFDIGGMPDIIKHMFNGYLVRPLDTDDFAKGINWVLEDSDRLQKLSHRAREKAEQEFLQELQASRYLSLFEDIFSNRTLK